MMKALMAPNSETISNDPALVLRNDKTSPALIGIIIVGVVNDCGILTYILVPAISTSLMNKAIVALLAVWAIP